jgi:hypothetical protein
VEEELGKAVGRGILGGGERGRFTAEDERAVVAE